MNYYLSSYKFGHKPNNLKELISSNNKIGHINNARDFIGRDPALAARNQREEIDFLNELGFQAEPLDLKNYFGANSLLENKIDSLGALWVSGGNVFVLRQAMKLSGFDRIFETIRNRESFLYAGYSAGICVLSDTLKPIELVDDPQNFPYESERQTIYDGLGVFDYSFMPHFNSDHPESKDIDHAIQHCIENKWLFKALKDGEVIIIKSN